jgi:hypothetical protein
MTNDSIWRQEKASAAVPPLPKPSAEEQRAYPQRLGKPLGAFQFNGLRDDLTFLNGLRARGAIPVPAS